MFDRKEANKKYRQKNQDKIKEKQREYYQNNKDRIKSTIKKYNHNKKWISECKNFRLFFNNINKDFDNKLMKIKMKNSRKKAQNKWREKNKEKLKEYEKRDYVKQKRKESCKKWRSKNKEHIKQYDKIHGSIYYQKNKERIRLRQDEYDRRNMKHLKRKEKEWRERNREKLLIDKKTDYYKNWHRYQKTNREYYDRNPQKFYKQNIKQLKKFGNVLKMPFEQYNFALLSWSKTIKKLYGNQCIICGSKEKLNAHHILHKAKYPKLSLNINNGIPLCKIHHDEVHGKNLILTVKSF